MKKILLILAVMLMGAFASPLFAVDKIGCDVEKSQGTLMTKDTIKVSNVKAVSVNALYQNFPPSYNLGEGLDTKIQKNSGCSQNANIILVKTGISNWGSFIPYENVAKTTVAVVCHHRGVSGCDALV